MIKEKRKEIRKKRKNIYIHYTTQAESRREGEKKMSGKRGVLEKGKGRRGERWGEGKRGNRG